MSQTSMPTSNEGDGAPESASNALDFLYHDVRRVQSFLAQFREEGHPSQLRRTSTTGKGSSTRYTASASGEVPFIAKGGGSAERSSSKEGRSSLEEVIDPFWSNAREFLETVQGEGLLKDGLEARIGNLIRCTGTLILIDLGFIQRIVQVKELKDILRKREVAGAISRIDRTSLTKSDLARQEAAARKNAEEVFGQNVNLLQVISNSTHCHLLMPNFAVWGTLIEENLVPTPSNLMLKHGVIIDGQWTMVGILDALPGRAELTPDTLATLHPIIGDVGVGTIQIAQYARNLFGKPPASGGVTPLLIYREIQTGSH